MLRVLKLVSELAPIIFGIFFRYFSNMLLELRKKNICIHELMTNNSNLSCLKARTAFRNTLIRDKRHAVSRRHLIIHLTFNSSHCQCMYRFWTNYQHQKKKLISKRNHITSCHDQRLLIRSCENK